MSNNRDTSTTTPFLADPFEQFAAWYNEADGHESVRYAHAATLATSGRNGPDARIVLVHGWSGGGFIFGSDTRSAKAEQLRHDPSAALVFYWPELERQVRLRGRIEDGGEDESDQTFDDRPRESRITAWSSQQSRAIASREVLERRFDEARARFDDSQPVPRPDTWRAYRLVPKVFEFWSARRFRLHERIIYRRQPNGDWRRGVLEP